MYKNIIREVCYTILTAGVSGLLYEYCTSQYLMIVRSGKYMGNIVGPENIRQARNPSP